MSEDVKPKIAEELTQEEIYPTKYITYNYRWFILVLFSLVSISSAFQWPMYVIIANVVEQYYGVSLGTVNWTATIFLLCYAIFLYPATYLVEKYGLRFAMILAAIGPCIGAFIKLLSVDPSRFWIILLGQTIIATTQTYLSFLPASVAAAWFGPEQISTACGIATVGIQVAVSIGTITPTAIFSGNLTINEVEKNLHQMNIGITIFTSVVLLLIVLFCRSEPPTPPSQTRTNIKLAKLNLQKSLKNIVKDVPFVLFWISNSSVLGIFFAVCFLLNPTILQYHPDNISDIGIIGLLFMGFGVIGCAVFGIILDQFRRFKETAVFVYVSAVVCMIAYTFTLSQGIIYVYIFQTAVGFILAPVVSVGLEVGAEITYPIPESISSGLLLIGGKIFGIIFTIFFSHLFSKNFGIWTQFAMSAVIALSAILVLFTPFELKRQTVNKNVENKDCI